MRPAPLPVLLSLATGCGPPEVVGPAPSDDSAPAAEENCNGVDDDGDGEVDEGFPDADRNGRADCLDTACPRARSLPERAAPVDPACAGSWAWPVEVVADPWSYEVRWLAVGPAGWSIGEGPPVTPVVLNLTDDDGDGDADRHDRPEVVVVVCQPFANEVECTTLALDGATGAELWHSPTSSSPNQLVAGDLDGDGQPEVLTTAADGRPALLDADGLRDWTAEEAPTTNDGAHATAADLDGDGVPEVLVDDRVYDGADGDLEAVLDVPPPWTGGSHAVGDLDGDGLGEVAFGDGVFRADGTRAWSTGEPSPASGPWPMLVQADADPLPEVVFVGTRVALFDGDGARLSEFDLPSGTAAGPPCAGDLDGDGLPELALPTYPPGTLTVVGFDGAIRWSRTLSDQEGWAGCVVFDFDGDGAAEVVHAGEAALVVLDGLTGVVRANWADAASTTGTETAAVADVDADGHAELVVAGDGYQGGFAGVAVLGHSGAGWSPGGPTWSNASYSGEDVDPDGRVPTTPGAGWRDHGLWRGRPVQDGLPPSADLVLEVLDTCAADCTWGPAQLTVRITNRGGRESAATTLRVRLEGEPALPLLERTIDPVPPGTALASRVLDLPLEALGGPLRVELVAVEDACDPADEAVVVDLGC